MLESLLEFAFIYDRRPIRDNFSGMRAPHLFAVWFMARHLSPDLVVESGIWKGQSTWILETACPAAKIIAIDPDLSPREYISPRVVYSDRDFSEQDWSQATERSLAFFDDHQNAYERLQQCKWFGFKHVIFEDNYPVTRGDCYSLKKAFAHAGFEPEPPPRPPTVPLWDRVRAGAAFLVGNLPSCAPIQPVKKRIPPNPYDAAFLRRNLRTYCEFPPVFRPELTRWGDRWDEGVYPTPEALLTQPGEPCHTAFLEEAAHYTWICYAELE